MRERAKARAKARDGVRETVYERERDETPVAQSIKRKTKLTSKD